MPLENFFLDYGKQDRQPGEFVRRLLRAEARAGHRISAPTRSPSASTKIFPRCSPHSPEDRRTAGSAKRRLPSAAWLAIPKRAQAVEAALRGLPLAAMLRWHEAADAVGVDFTAAHRSARQRRLSPARRPQSGHQGAGRDCRCGKRHDAHRRTPDDRRCRRIAPHRRRRCATSTRRCRMTAPPSTCRAPPNTSTTFPSRRARLHVAVGGSPVARGTIRGLDLAEVRKAPGVVAVVTAADIPGKNDVSPSFADEPVLAEGLRHVPRPAGVRRGCDIARCGAARALRPRYRYRSGAPACLRRAGQSVRRARSSRLRLHQRRCRQGDCGGAVSQFRHAPHRRPGTLLSGRPGRARRAGRGRRHAGPLVHPASQRSAAHRRPRSRAAGFLRDLQRAPHGRRLRRQGDAGDAVGGHRRSRRARHRPALQAPARPRCRHGHDRQASRLRRCLRRRL